MNAEQQSIVALLIVAITALVFVARYIKQKRSGNCSAGCGCSSSKPAALRKSK